MKKYLAGCIATVFLTSGSFAQSPMPFKALAQMPVKEVTVFKDTPGADADLSITAAVDIRVKKTDNETKRTPNAAVWQGDQYGRIDLAGKITLTSFRKDAVEVEVTRNVLGNVDSADNNGKTEMVNIFENPTFFCPQGRAAFRPCRNGCGFSMESHAGSVRLSWVRRSSSCMS